MREQLAALAKLAEIDAAAREVERELEETPARLNELRADVKKLDELLDAERQQLAEAEQLFKAQEEELQEQNESLGRSKAKSARARNMREADAVERELEAVRRTVKEREEERERLSKVLEQVRSSLETHEKELSELQQVVSDEESKASDRMKELESKKAEIVAGREDVAEKVKSSIVRRYNLIRSRRQGIGVAKIVGGTCTQCNMRLPPQLVIQIKKAEAVEQCPGCNRILYDEDLDAEAQPS